MRVCPLLGGLSGHRLPVLAARPSATISDENDKAATSGRLGALVSKVDGVLSRGLAKRAITAVVVLACGMKVV